MDSTPLISVVTPFYRRKTYLAECVESVLAQTYTNWKYILVNNCSSDRSVEVVKRYVDRFPNKIRLYHTKSFLSQVQNYNYALSLISEQSKYCKMVQADDWIFPDCLKSMAELAEEHPRVAIVAAYELEGDDASLGGLPYPRAARSKDERLVAFSLREICRFSGTPTSLLMRSEVVRSRSPAFYDERHAPFEDSHVCFDLL